MCMLLISVLRSKPVLCEFKTTWSTQCVPDQPGLHSEALSQKQKGLGKVGDMASWHLPKCAGEPRFNIQYCKDKQKEILASQNSANKSRKVGARETTQLFRVLVSPCRGPGFSS